MATQQEIQAVLNDYTQNELNMNNSIKNISVNWEILNTIEQNIKRNTGKRHSLLINYIVGDLLTDTNNDIFKCVADNIGQDINDINYFKKLTKQSASVGQLEVIASSKVNANHLVSNVWGDTSYKLTVQRNSTYSFQFNLDPSIVADNNYAIDVHCFYTSRSSQVYWNICYKTATEFIVHVSRSGISNVALAEYIDIHITLYKI